DDGSSGTLRAMVAAATPGDTIVFAPSLNGQKIKLTQGQINLNKSLDIEGPGATQLTVSGTTANPDRVFDISKNLKVTIAGLTIPNGSVTADEVTNFGGGGILNEAGATLTLTNCKVADNTAKAASPTVDVFGGGLLNEGKATVTSCTFSGNKA